MDRGNAYRKKRDYDCAVADFDRAINVDQGYARAYVARGNLFREKGDYDHAIAEFDRAIELDPTYAPAYADRGGVYEKKGDYDRAIADLDRAAQLDPNHASILNAACWVRATANRDLAMARAYCDGGRGGDGTDLNAGVRNLPIPQCAAQAGGVALKRRPSL